MSYFCEYKVAYHQHNGHHLSVVVNNRIPARAILRTVAVKALDYNDALTKAVDQLVMDGFLKGCFAAAVQRKIKARQKSRHLKTTINVDSVQHGEFIPRTIAPVHDDNVFFLRVFNAEPRATALFLSWMNSPALATISDCFFMSSAPVIVSVRNTPSSEKDAPNNCFDIYFLTPSKALAVEATKLLASHIFLDYE